MNLNALSRPAEVIQASLLDISPLKPAKFIEPISSEYWKGSIYAQDIAKAGVSAHLVSGQMPVTKEVRASCLTVPLENVCVRWQNL